MTFNPSSPDEAVASSISGESKIRWIEYRTSSSSSINSSLLILARRIAGSGKRDRGFWIEFAAVDAERAGWNSAGHFCPPNRGKAIPKINIYLPQPSIFFYGFLESGPDTSFRNINFMMKMN
jgi:hypothetical protein